MECAAVRDRLLRVGFGLDRDDVGEAVERHMAACAVCRAEVDVLRRLMEGMAAEAEPLLVTAGFDMRTVDGQGTAYWTISMVNAEQLPQQEFGMNTGGDLGALVLYDARGRRLEELWRQRMDNGVWALRYRLHEPWLPGTALRVVTSAPGRLPTRPEGDHRRLHCSARPLDADDRMQETLYRWMVQLPPGCRALHGEPAPERVLGDARVVMWSTLVPRGETVHFRLSFTDGARRGSAALRFPEGSVLPPVEWRWSRAGEPYLTQLCEDQRLDALVAGLRDDFERVRRVSHWVHGLWPHDGSNEPERRDPAAILREAAAGKRFRCVEYSVVMAGCLTALGLPARTLSLMTADVETRESGAGHVVVEAYLRDRGRWVVADAQWDVVPRLGEQPLCAVELQRAIAEGDPALVMDGLAGPQAEHYASWMFRYLHFFKVSLDNRVGVEGRSPRQRLLVPDGSTPPRVFQRTHPIGDVEYVRVPEAIYPVPDV